MSECLTEGSFLARKTREGVKSISHLGSSQPQLAALSTRFAAEYQHRTLVELTLVFRFETIFHACTGRVDC